MESSNDAITIDVRPFIWPITSIIITLILSITIIITANILVAGGGGIGSGNVGAVRGTTTTRTDTGGDGGTAVVNAGGDVTVSIDDDAILGDISTATVAIIEFSDYECPFCQSFWKDTLSTIEETYVNSGQVVIVYRDLPLSFHEPMASFAANLTECARDQGGDDAYYATHDLWFANTPANGTGLAEDRVISLANDAGLDGNKLVECANAGTYTEEIKADAAVAASIGINGTPGFVVGKLDADGNVTGEIISGAYPFDEFDRAIQDYL